MPFIDRAQGAELTDIDGNVYLDFLNDFTVAIYGHSHPVLLSAAARQLERGLSYGGCIEAEAVLAEEVRCRFPMMQRLRFANSGTEANLYALLATLATGNRRRVGVFEGAYHGGVLNFAQPGARINAPFDFVQLPYNDIEALEAVLAADGTSLGAVLFEPMLNSGGCVPAEPAFACALRELTARAQIPLIVDEVMTARLGYHGLQGELGIAGDMVTLGKIIGGGFSIGAFGGDERFMAQFDASRTGYTPHGGSFNNNAMSMSVGAVALTEVLTSGAQHDLNALGDHLREGLAGLFRSRGLPVCVSGRGSVMNLHAGSEPPARPRSDPRNAPLRALFHRHMLLSGYWIATRCLIATSLVTDDAMIDGFLSAAVEFCDRHGAAIRSPCEVVHA
jgi:glutamate-1-semialdehyde 2,1-aminomutase